MFAYRKLTEMPLEDKRRACYQHACLLHVSGQIMTNATLRKRLSIDERNYSTASRIIAETIKVGWIKPQDLANTAPRHAKYLPFWA